MIGRRFASFGLAGLIATLVHIAIFSALIEWHGLSAVAASVPAFLLAMLVSYSANRRWTFKAHPAQCLPLARYAVVSLLGLGLNMSITYFMVDVLSYGAGVALATIILLVPPVIFMLNKTWTFTVRAG